MKLIFNLPKRISRLQEGNKKKQKKQGINTKVTILRGYTVLFQSKTGNKINVGKQWVSTISKLAVK